MHMSEGTFSDDVAQTFVNIYTGIVVSLDTNSITFCKL